jgi:hypothetical protein
MSHFIPIKMKWMFDVLVDDTLHCKWYCTCSESQNKYFLSQNMLKIQSLKTKFWFTRAHWYTGRQFLDTVFMCFMRGTLSRTNIRRHHSTDSQWLHCHSQVSFLHSVIPYPPFPTMTSTIYLVSFTVLKLRIIIMLLRKAFPSYDRKLKIPDLLLLVLLYIALDFLISKTKISVFLTTFICSQLFSNMHIF